MDCDFLKRYLLFQFHNCWIVLEFVDGRRKRSKGRNLIVIRGVILFACIHSHTNPIIVSTFRFLLAGSPILIARHYFSLEQWRWLRLWFTGPMSISGSPERGSNLLQPCQPKGKSSLSDGIESELLHGPSEMEIDPVNWDNAQVPIFNPPGRVATSAFFRSE